MEKKRGNGINVGSAMLVMIFSVLCLTVFSVLSLVTANNELNMSKKTAQAVENYYNADFEACGIVEGIKKDIADGKETENSFSVKIDENRDLQVELLQEADGIKISKWEVTPIVWDEVDTTLPVWEGK